MDIRLYNTLTNQLDTFTPITPGRVLMYNCGPTVYDFAHIGNFRSFLFADLLRRTLEFHGYTVEQVMNLTDVGHMTEDAVADGAGQDKMELASQRLKQAKKQGKADVADPDDPYQVAQFFIDALLPMPGACVCGWRTNRTTCPGPRTMSRA
jgi:cysteinyl-tRNA synthetase